MPLEYNSYIGVHLELSMWAQQVRATRSCTVFWVANVCVSI